MRLISQLFISVGVLLAIALGGVGLTLWSAQQTAFHLERTNFAHSVYEAYLTLSNHTYQLFKQFGDAMLIGDRDRGSGELELMEKIRGDIARIRDLIGYEIELVGAEEIEELNDLARIERQIEILLTEYQGIIEAKKDISFTENWGRLSRMLDRSIDQDFHQLIMAAIAGEVEEVNETRTETAEKIRLFETLAGGFALVAVIAAALGLWKLMRNIQTPINRLLAGTSALERGELDFRVEATGPAELSELAYAFNRMAVEFSTRSKALTHANANLEQTVANRTVELTRLLDTLKDSEAKRRRLLADVSHELRTPLTIIRGEADIALRGQHKPPEVYREALVKCRESAEHTARLVDDLLFIARREGGEVRLVLGEVDLATLVPRVIKDCHSLVVEGGGSILFNSGLSDAVIRADEQRIRQVIVILLENALRYANADIEVHLDRAPSGYAISVSDNGPGMSEDELACAFERFFRGSNAAERYASGAGLGLPVAKAIVEAHAGTITLDSELGQGLTASFTLPSKTQLQAVS